jgi:hypothetical protein
VDKVLTDKEQGLVEFRRQRVGKAITEIEPRGMPSAPTEATVRVAGDHDLAESNWLDGYTKASDQIIKGRAKDWTWVSIHRDCGFQHVCRGHECGR